METIYRFQPVFAAENCPQSGSAGSANWGRAHVAGCDVRPSATARRYRHGRADHAAGGAVESPVLFSVSGSCHAGARGAPDEVALLHAPGQRSSTIASGTLSPCSPGAPGRGPGQSGPAPRPGSGWWRAAGTLARAEWPGLGVGQDARHRNGGTPSRPSASHVRRRNNASRSNPALSSAYERNTGKEHALAQGGIEVGNHGRGFRARQGLAADTHDLPAHAIRHSEHTGDSLAFKPEEPHFLKEIDSTARARLPAQASEAPSWHVRGTEVKRRGQEIALILRESSTPTRVRVRGRLLTPGAP